MIIVDGKKIAKDIIESLKKMPRPEKLLAAIFVGSSKASESFLKQKRKTAEELGVKFRIYQFEEAISEEDLKKEIKKVGDDNEIGGVIIQLPLPNKFNRDKILAVLNPEKDIDALISNRVPPLGVSVVQDIFKSLNYNFVDKIVAVVGRGLLIGKPIAEWLRGKCKEILIFHSQTNLADLKKADLVITGVGKTGLIKSEMLKDDAGVIDFGFDLVDGKIRGDLDIDKVTNQPSNKLTFYTPTPGGTGPILVAELFKNFYLLNK